MLKILIQLLNSPQIGAFQCQILHFWKKIFSPKFKGQLIAPTPASWHDARCYWS